MLSGAKHLGRWMGYVGETTPFRKAEQLAKKLVRVPKIRLKETGPRLIGIPPRLSHGPKHFAVML
jgi:hypothetical protein